MQERDRITRRTEAMGGHACMRGMRIAVGMIIGQLGAGHCIEEMLMDYAYLAREDILQALRYAATGGEERGLS